MFKGTERTWTKKLMHKKHTKEQTKRFLEQISLYWYKVVQPNYSWKINDSLVLGHLKYLNSLGRCDALDALGDDAIDVFDDHDDWRWAIILLEHTSAYVALVPQSPFRTACDRSFVCSGVPDLTKCDSATPTKCDSATATFDSWQCAHLQLPPSCFPCISGTP